MFFTILITSIKKDIEREEIKHDLKDWRISRGGLFHNFGPAIENERF